MDPEDNLHKLETRRNLKDKILTQYGREILKKVFKFERHRLLLTKKNIDLTFLKRCKDSSIIPTFAKINHFLRNQHNNKIFKLELWVLIDSASALKAVRLEQLKHEIISTNKIKIMKYHNNIVK